MKPQVIGLWLALGITIALGALWEFQSLPDASDRMSKLTAQNPMVQLQTIPLLPAEEIAFQGCSSLKRLVVTGPDQVILTVLDGTHNRHAIHDPTFCFRGAGWEIEKEESFPLRQGAGTLVKLTKDGSKAEALYWFSDGRKQFSNPLSYWEKTSLRRISFGASGAEPVLIILSPTTETPPHWNEILQAWPELQQL